MGIQFPKSLPRKADLPPRGEAWVKYINNSLLRNTSLGGEETSVMLPPLVERAYLLVNETAPITVEEYPTTAPFRVKQ